MKNFIDGFKLAFSFLTVIPFKAEYNNKTIRYSLYFYPLAGLLTGLILYFCVIAGLKYLLKYAQFTAAVLLLTEYLISNFFHIDGFCDTVDALYFTKPGKDKLAILRDPHIGAYAVVWLIILMLFKYCAFYMTIRSGNILILLLFPVIGYLFVPFHTFFSKPLFEQGLGRSIKENTDISHCIINTLITFGIVYFIMRDINYLIYVIICSLVFIIMLHKMIANKFGGFNGDTVGFGIESLKLLVFTACIIKLIF